MNRPPRGDAFRRGQYAHVMFQPSAQDTPNMTVKINQGSFWVNNTTFVEYAGGASPKIEAPVSGAKWVLIAINKLGTPVLFNGIVMPNNPEPPEVDKNVLPIAFVFVKSSTKLITNDMIFDARPVFAAGGYPLKHNQLQGRDAVDCHPMQSITGLNDKLTEKLDVSEAQNLLAEKADSDGTNAANFTLNKDDSGVPVEYCGIRVNRGSLPEVGLRYNEDGDKWEYTNDGSTWHPFGMDTDTFDMATAYTAGLTKLSVDPVNASEPIAVGTNDPRLAKIDQKADKADLAKFVTSEDVDKKIVSKANADDVYSKSDAENIFVTRADFDLSGGYTKDQLNRILNLKANASAVYTRVEIEEKLSQIYSKTEIDKLLADHKCNCGGGGSGSADLTGYYTAKEVDALLQKLADSEYTKDAIDAKFVNEKTITDNLSTKIDTKADISNVYSKTEMDTKIATINSGSALDTTKYYTKADVNLLLTDKADINHGHTAGDISQDSTHRFVTDDEITAWNNKANALGYTAENVANKAVANGYASLDSTGKVPLSQLPVMGSVGAQGVKIVNTYADMTALTATDAQVVFVKDATADTTVKSGWAQYMYEAATKSWVKTAEQEGLDVVLDWANVTNKPTTFNPDLTKLTDYAKTGTTGSVYTKTEVDNLLVNKSDTNHNHDDKYVTPATLTTQLATKLDNTDSRLHPAVQVGSYNVNETGMADGMVLYFDATYNQLKYKTISSSGTTEPVNYYKLGSIEVDEPTAIKDGYVLTYDSASKKLTYKAPATSASSDKVGTVTIDESSIGTGKVLTYNGTKLVYSALPQNLIDIDNTNQKQGRVLAYNGNGKLEYVDMTSSSGGSGILEYHADATGGENCIVRANKANAVKYEVNGNKVRLTIDPTAQIYSIQFDLSATDIGQAILLHVDMINSDGSTYTWDTFKGHMPIVGYYAIDGNYNFKTTSVKYDIDNPMTYEIRAIQTGYGMRVKMVY